MDAGHAAQYCRGVETLSKTVRVAHSDIHRLGKEHEPQMVVDGVGDVMTLPASLGYALTVHKGQGLTLARVYAILEGLFAHGQVYVQTLRTRSAEQFFCVGVPPVDLLPEVLKRVKDEGRRATAAWERLRELERHDKNFLDALMAQSHSKTSELHV